MRTLAEIPVEVELRGPAKTPIFQVIAPEAAQMRERGVPVTRIAGHVGVDFHTADKAIRWHRQP